MPERASTAVWEGDIRGGKGTMTIGSGADQVDLHNQLFDNPRLRRATDDGFFLAIEARDPERADAAVAEHARQTLRWWGFLNPSFD